MNKKDEGFVEIAETVIENIMRDYSKTLTMYKKYKTKDNLKALKRCEREIKSDWFTILTMGLADPNEIIKTKRIENNVRLD